MVAYVLPIGHLLGPSYSGRSAAPDSYDIRVGDRFFRLDHNGFRTWVLAHGFPELIERRAPTRAQVEEQARQTGVNNSNVVFSELLQEGLIVQVVPVASQLQQFAVNYRACALGLGLGNTAEEPASYAIGTPEDPWVIVDEQTYFIWSYMSDFPSLWDAAIGIASLEQLISEHGIALTATQILSIFMGQLPMLIATNCLYFDWRP